MIPILIYFIIEFHIRVFELKLLCLPPFFNNTCLCVALYVYMSNFLDLFICFSSKNNIVSFHVLLDIKLSVATLTPYPIIDQIRLF